MIKAIEISQEERLDNLAERVKAIFVEGGFNVKMVALEARHKVGEEIVTDTLYKKWGKGTGDLIKKLAVRIERSKSELYFCVRMYEMFPTLDNLVMKLPGGKSEITVRAARAIVEGRELLNHKHQVQKVEAWQCKICGQLLVHKP